MGMSSITSAKSGISCTTTASGFFSTACRSSDNTSNGTLADSDQLAALRDQLLGK